MSRWGIAPQAQSRSGGPVVAILGFHQIGEAPAGGSPQARPFYLPEATFARHLRYLQKTGWQVIDAAAFVRGLSAPETLPARAALLTFDDGHRSFREVALPWLKRFGCPAVLFVPTDFIGGRSIFEADGEQEQPICDWDDLWFLQEQGVSIQSHSASHRPFSALSPAEQADEITRSKTVLEKELGRAADLLAYPYGDQGKNPELPGLLGKIGYQAACAFGGGPVRLPAAAPFALARVPVGPHTDLAGALGTNRLLRGVRRRLHRFLVSVRAGDRGRNLPPW